MADDIFSNDEVTVTTFSGGAARGPCVQFTLEDGSYFSVTAKTLAAMLPALQKAASPSRRGAQLETSKGTVRSGDRIVWRSDGALHANCGRVPPDSDFTFPLNVDDVYGHAQLVMREDQILEVIPVPGNALEYGARLHQYVEQMIVDHEDDQGASRASRHLLQDLIIYHERKDA